jgi:hypothetical protein
MKKLKVDKSKIAGKGLFTTDIFEQGEMIGLAHENDQPSTFIGKYHNHSDDPNAVSVKLGDKRYLMAKRPLKKGEEITTNYRLQPELEQPDDFAKGGLVKMPKPSKQGLASKKFSKSLDATNRLFTENYLFSKAKSKKRKVFDPNAKYQDGGTTLPEDYSQFQTFAETLPSNLQDPSFEYGNADQYDLYGMWETVGKPGSFADVQDSEYFPLDEDGTYHGFTVGSDGTLLKPMSHNTTWKEVMNSQLSTDPFFQQNTLIRNEQGRLQYIPKAEYGMPMGTGMSQNYQGRTKFIHQDGGELDCPPGYTKDEYGNCMRVQNTEPVTVYNSKQYDGVITQRDINNANNAMMKARLAYADMHGNPAAQRMVVAPDQPYKYTGDEYDQLWGQPVGAEPGMIGTHYMASFGNYAVPFIQQGPNGLYFNEAPSVRDREAIRFDNEDDAQYFGEHYKEVTPDESYRQEEYATGGVAFPLDLNPETMKKYREVLKVQENSIKSGYRKAEDKWYPHRSPEGGADTVGFGHKLIGPDANKYNKGLTTKEAENLLDSDILKHQTVAENLIDKKYGKGTFDSLPQDSQMLLVDYAYNGVLNSFPTFTDALVKGDKQTMLKEYERFGNTGPLKERNAWTQDTIIKGNFNPTPKALPKNNTSTSSQNNKDKWGRSPNTIWYGFNPDTKQYEQEGLDWEKYGDPGPGIGGPGAGAYITPGERLSDYQNNKTKKLQEGGDIISQQGWDYMKEGDKYLTRRAGAQDWIEAQGKPLQAIKQNIFQEASVPAPVAPVVEQPTQPTQPTTQPISGDPKVLEIQTKLKEAGYDLGNYGPNKDGIDGVMGNRTKLAYDAFKANVPPEAVKVPKTTTKPTLNYTVNRNLPEGYLPVMQGYGQEICTKDKGCSANVSIKMENLLGNLADGSLWANDAWFNKSDILNKGGDLVYDSSSKNYKEMGKVPKEVYSKLQVGDYVQLNRTDTASSGKFAAQTKDGLQNEQIEHLGFVVGKDKDGTPLIWHGSETGKAFIKRIDEPITLDDHDKNIFTYKVSSIVRSPNLKDVDFSGLQNSPYYTPVDPNKKLVPKQGATELQSQATKTFNNAIGQFKNLGYSQDDANYVGQILIGGIMQNESESGESWSRLPKEAAATVVKNYLGYGNFEGDEASVGYYQMKPNYNFKNKDGGLNPLGKKLQKLGVEVDDITSNNIDAQTLAGTLILLDNYKKLKENPDFDSKTNLYKGKIPASYILAKSWQSGSGWESREKYQKFLNDLDIDYSDNALNSAANLIGVTEGKSIDPELAKLQQQQAAIRAKKVEENRKKVFAEEQKYQTVKADTARKLPTVAESTAINPIYNQRGPKSFDAASYIAQGPSKTIYTYAGRPGAMYKKDDKGNWYINLGSQTGNQFVKIQDKDGSRSAILNKSAVPSASKKYSQGGGIYMELTDSEIEQFRRGGYIIEDLD